MAERLVTAPARVRAPGRRRAMHPVAAYAAIALMWVRASMAYRASFVLLSVAQFATTGLDFAAIFIMFTHATELGGYTLPQVAFLYGASGCAIGLADLLVGSVERVGERIRDGSLDTMLVRPVSAFAQVCADQFALRRIGRIAQSAVVFGWACGAVDVRWTPVKVLLVPEMIVLGTAIFVAIFVLGGAFQFAATDAPEVANSFTYGGNTLTQYPPTIFPRELLLATVFAMPLAFVNWLPSLHVLGKADPLGLPPAFQFAGPVAAAALCAAAGLAWRAGIRGYRSTGS